MFDFLGMESNYKDRLVENTKVGGGEVDTVMVTDSEEPYETGICHPQYNEGSWVIVEMYNTKEEAKEGHKRWVEVFSKDELPIKLQDVGTSAISELCAMVKDICAEDVVEEAKRIVDK